jgi:hypothetical protein
MKNALFFFRWQGFHIIQPFERIFVKRSWRLRPVRNSPIFSICLIFSGPLLIRIGADQKVS